VLRLSFNVWHVICLSILFRLADFLSRSRVWQGKNISFDEAFFLRFSILLLHDLGVPLMSNYLVYAQAQAPLQPEAEQAPKRHRHVESWHAVAWSWRGLWEWHDQTPCYLAPVLTFKSQFQHSWQVKEDMMLKLFMTSSDGKKDLSSLSRKVTWLEFKWRSFSNPRGGWRGILHQIPCI